MRSPRDFSVGPDVFTCLCTPNFRPVSCAELHGEYIHPTRIGAIPASFGIPAKYDGTICCQHGPCNLVLRRSAVLRNTSLSLRSGCSLKLTGSSAPRRLCDQYPQVVNFPRPPLVVAWKQPLRVRVVSLPNTVVFLTFPFHSSITVYMVSRAGWEC